MRENVMKKWVAGHMGAEISNKGREPESKRKRKEENPWPITRGPAQQIHPL